MKAEGNKWFHCKTSRLLGFFSKVFKGITQILFQICLISQKKYYWHLIIQLPALWNHYYLFNVAESNIIIYGRLSSKWNIWWMLSTFWKTTCPVWFAAYNCSNSSKNNPEKTIYSSKKWAHQRSMHSCFKPKRGHFCAKSAH